MTEEQKVKPTTEMMVEVTAIQGYSNGSIPGAANWRAGEMRLFPRALIAQLENDLPGNWRVAWPKP
jgi:hypothetical protein